jgi:cell wall-associated protease
MIRDNIVLFKIKILNKTNKRSFMLKLKKSIGLLILLISFTVTNITYSSLFTNTFLPRLKITNFLKQKSILYSKYDSSTFYYWAQLSPEKDGYEGTRTIKFFAENNINVTDTVIVAIIDSGFDIDHPDLKYHIWKNYTELFGSPGIDDDNNGYIDDFYGWNFLGNAEAISYEFVREYYKLKKLSVSENDPYFIKVKTEFETKLADAKSTYEYVKKYLIELENAENTLKKKNYPTDPEELSKIKENLKGEFAEAADLIIFYKVFLGFNKSDLYEYYKETELKLKYAFDSTSPSVYIGDNPSVLEEKGYGNNNVRYRNSSHGTHVAGIIASSRKGIGQAPFVKLMLLRAVPDEGDERDKDIANAIKYAVDNGASIINLSAGKYFASNPDYVIEAIKYAGSHNVLFVCSAGNENMDITNSPHYPPKYYLENGAIEYFNNVIVVGASSWFKKWDEQNDPMYYAPDYDLKASFSNYSSTVVDVFAPGVYIYSTIPNGNYMFMSGTSMASPVVTGIAAILKSIKSDLTAAELKQIITNSVRKYTSLKVVINNEKTEATFSTLSRSGGVVDLINAYEYMKKRYGIY